MSKHDIKSDEWLDEQVKKAEELETIPVEIRGLTQEQAGQVNEVLGIANGQVIAQLKATLTQYETYVASVNLHLDFYKKLAKELGKSALKKQPIYKELKEKIKILEDDLAPFIEQVAILEEQRDDYLKRVDAIRNKIKVSYNEDKTVCYYDYDTDYFTAILDVAYLTLPITIPEKVSDQTEQS